MAKRRKTGKPKAREGARPVTNEAFEPTTAHRTQVEALAAYGVPHEHIRLFVINPATGAPINSDTLKKRFASELEIGRWKMVAKVGETLYELAVGRPAEYDADGKVLRAERGPEVAAAIFIMKARAQWSDRVVHEHTGKDGGPIEVVPVPLPFTKF